MFNLFLQKVRQRLYGRIFLFSWLSLGFIHLTSAAPCLDLPEDSIQNNTHVISTSIGIIYTTQCLCIQEQSSDPSAPVQYLSISKSSSVATSSATQNLIPPDSIVCVDENDAFQPFHDMCDSSINVTQPNTTYYFKNTTEQNEYFACTLGETFFTAFKAGLKKCDDGRFTDRDDDCNTSKGLELLNFSGAGNLSGDAKDLILGFILEGDGSADIKLHADVIEMAVAPKLTLYEVVHDDLIGLHGQQKLYKQDTQSFTLDNVLDSGIYTMLLSSTEFKGRGATGITLKNNHLNLTNVSVRGDLKSALSLNFIVGGEGTQKVKMNHRILEGEIQTQQLTLVDILNNRILQSMSHLESGETMEVEITEGAYGLLLQTTPSEGIGMLELNYTL